MKNKKAKNVLLAIMGVLIVVEIIGRLATIQSYTFSGVAQLLTLVFTALYGFWFYKKPHGNMLKYAMLIFAFVYIVGCSPSIKSGNSLYIIPILASAVVCYCAGRLNRIEQNRIILPILSLAYLGISIYATCNGLMANAPIIQLIAPCFSYTINYITLMIAYFVRYKEHKEAGLADAQKE